MASGRKRRVLQSIVREYIATGAPVPSEAVARNYGLGVSPATVRNDMAWLEEEGYILRPHTSSGAVPTDRGYRLFVESLEPGPALAPEEQRLVSHLFHQVERELEEWVYLAASVLAQLTRYVALATRPKAADSHFQRLEMVLLHRFLAVLILVLREARVEQQLLRLSQPLSQDDLAGVARRLNRAFSGLTAREIEGAMEGLPPVEAAVGQGVAGLMRRVDAREYEGPHFQGWRYLLEQPEFERGSYARALLDALEGRHLPAYLLPLEGGVKVVIGGENQEEALRQLSLVVGSYGVPGGLGGIIGVVGPTRMRYPQAIAAVRYVSEQLSHMVSQLSS